MREFLLHSLTKRKEIPCSLYLIGNQVLYQKEWKDGIPLLVASALPNALPMVKPLCTPRWPFWGPLVTIIDFAGSAALQAVVVWFFQSSIKIPNYQLQRSPKQPSQSILYSIRQPAFPQDQLLKTISKTTTNNLEPPSSSGRRQVVQFTRFITENWQQLSSKLA